jgi:CubicO group peptidase (beta-lactamase class C family)
VAESTSRTPVDAKGTVFQVASLSKAVTAWGVLRLAETKRLDLDAPVETVLTRWRLPTSPFDGSGVTARRLLSHTAGLSLAGYPGFPPGGALPTLEESLSGATNGAGDVRLIRPPGSGFQYSGGGFTLLQLVIEEVTDERFEVFMRREVLRPLGLLDSDFGWTESLRARSAQGHDEDGRPLPDFLFTARAAAGLYSTASDLAEWVAAGVEGPEGERPGRDVLLPRSVTELHQPARGTGGVYGLGHEVIEMRNGRRAVGHSGANRGWRARFAFVPEQATGVVVLANGDGGTGITEEVVRLWLERTTGSLPGPSS